MFRKLWIGKLLILMLLLQFTIPAFADISDDTEINDAMHFAENKADDAQYKIDDLNIMKGTMNKLIDEWAANKAAIKNGIGLTLAVLLGTTGAVLSICFSGGATYVGTKAAAVITIKIAIGLGVAISAHSGYVDAMEAAINAVDSQLTEIEKAIVYYSAVYDDDSKTYNGAYEQYLKILAAHTGHEATWIDDRVNNYDIDSDTFPHKQIAGQGWTPTHKHFGDERDNFFY